MGALPKKERLRLRRELAKLQNVLGGVRDLNRPPDAVFIIDVKTEHIAVTEAARLGIPIIAVVDTNCDPDHIDFVIPGNDDAIRSSQLLSNVIASAAKDGRSLHSAGRAKAAADAEAEVEAAAAGAGE
jgi:small subunit ribosomal protein S2